MRRMSAFSEQSERFTTLNNRNRDLASQAVKEYHAAGGARLHGDDPEKARILRECLDRAGAELDRREGRYMNEAIVLEYDEAIAGSDIIRKIEGK